MDEVVLGVHRDDVLDHRDVHDGVLNERPDGRHVARQVLEDQVVLVGTELLRKQPKW